tara:strand:- start:296 stop:1453 length:1158 start_codon:yes stop_codon:yes gene_type:complete
MRNKYMNEVQLLQLAASEGDVQEITRLVRSGVNVNYTDSGCTPLHHAAGEGQIEAIKTLVRLGADINACDKNGKTPARWARINGERGAVDTLEELEGRGASSSHRGPRASGYDSPSGSSEGLPEFDQGPTDAELLRRYATAFRSKERGGYARIFQPQDRSSGVSSSSQGEVMPREGHAERIFLDGKRRGQREEILGNRSTYAFFQAFQNRMNCVKTGAEALGSGIVQGRKRFEGPAGILADVLGHVPVAGGMLGGIAKAAGMAADSRAQAKVMQQLQNLQSLSGAEFDGVVERIGIAFTFEAARDPRFTRGNPAELGTRQADVVIKALSNQREGNIRDIQEQACRRVNEESRGGAERREASFIAERILSAFPGVRGVSSENGWAR